MGGKVDLSQNVVAQGMVQAGVGPVWMTNASGAMKNRGFTATVVRNGAGDYTVQLDTQYPNTDLHVDAYHVGGAIAPANGPFVVGVSSIIPGIGGLGPAINLLIKDTNPAGAAAVDINFAIVVTLQEVSH